MGVDLGGVETLLRHESFGAMGRALSFAADAVEIDVVAHQIGHVDRDRLVRKGRKTDFAAAVEHAGGFIHRVGGTRAFDHVVDALAAGQPAHRLDRVFSAHIDDVVGAELAADLKPIVTRAGEDHR